MYDGKDSQRAFEYLCRVVDAKFGTITAALLFEMRKAAHDQTMVEAFHGICSQSAGVDGAAAACRLFDRAVGVQPDGVVFKDFTHLFKENRPLAEAIHLQTLLINKAMGGLYQGELARLRSTVCTPGLGVNAAGCCCACQSICKERSFENRLRERRRSLSSASSSFDPKPNAPKRTLSIDSIRNQTSSRQQQLKAQHKVVNRLDDRQARWRAKFELAMDAATSVIANLKAETSTHLGCLFKEARIKAEELASVQEQLAQACLAHEQASIVVQEVQQKAGLQLMEAQEVAAHSLAMASASETMRINRMKDMSAASQRLHADQLKELVEQHSLQVTHLYCLPVLCWKEGMCMQSSDAW